MTSLGVVALFHSDHDAIVMISRLLESAGFTVVSASIPDVRDGQCDVDALMTRHDPSVVVYDIGPPYAENWAMFEQLRARPLMCECRFVITAVNAAEVERLAAHDERVFEVVDKDSDLGELVHAVKEAARGRALIRADAAPRPDVTPMPERRFHDRREGWTPNDIYEKLREKREEVEAERRRAGRRATDYGPDHSNAA